MKQIVPWQRCRGGNHGQNPV